MALVDTVLVRLTRFSPSRPNPPSRAGVWPRLQPHEANPDWQRLLLRTGRLTLAGGRWTLVLLLQAVALVASAVIAVLRWTFTQLWRAAVATMWGTVAFLRWFYPRLLRALAELGWGFVAFLGLCFLLLRGAGILSWRFAGLMRRRFPWLGAVGFLRWATLAAVLGVVGWAALYEMRTSQFEARYFTQLDHGMSVSVEPGQSAAIHFPKSGPYDERLGYTALPQFISDLTSHGFAVEHQANWSTGLLKFTGWGAFPIYTEKDRAGLRIFDRSGEEVYRARFPDKAYRDYASVPPLVVNSLLFIEDRYLFDQKYPEHNAAIEWNRFALAAAGRIVRLVVPHFNEGGGSTLATQIEKFRHSPNGLTGGIGEKMRQMLTASARMYIGGRDTMDRRRQVVMTYLNSTPLASMPGYGEVIGVPEALWVWYGVDYNEAARALNSKPRNAAEWARKGQVYRDVLSLILSERRPSYYLLADRDALANLTDKYLRALAEAGVIEPQLRDEALAAPLRFRDQPPPITAVSYTRQKATEDTRNKLVSLLKLPDLYSLDRLDLTAETTIDPAAQSRISAVLQKLSDRKFVEASGMVGKQLLGGVDPGKVTYSFVLYERGANGNFLRVRADSANKPFDINSGGKLMLGSTAKLRTLATYLEIIRELHDRYRTTPPRELMRVAATAQDPLTAWAASYLAHTANRELRPMIDAAMQRSYSAEPGTFFTGGGNQGFGNFESSENVGSYTLLVAFQHSINLVYIRLLKDVVTYYNAQSGVELSRLLNDPNDPNHEAYLHRFVDADSKHFLYRYYKDMRGLTPQQMLDLMVHRARTSLGPITTVYLSMYPEARLAEYESFIRTHFPHAELTSDELWHAFITDTPFRLNLKDRAYVAGIHPLELWLATYLQDHPNASWNEVVEASADVRQQVYSWLFKGSLYKQDERIKILLEQDGFNRMLDYWRQLGYPFSHLVPSLGTALGASGDRPDALAELMGIILNDGVKLPSNSIERLRFAEGTPYETTLVRGAPPEQVMAPEVAQALRRVLMGVVEDGTASRLRGAYVTNGTPLAVGGKTGTGDNRFDHFAAGGGIASSRVVDRTATFVFFLGDRFFGTVTAYVPGPDAARFSFSSALAVQLLKVLQPELQPLLTSGGATAQAEPAGITKVANIQ
ncbi:MAG TPA: transglycosylase domain-containing protein [Stellaceae bacterium]|nr:transglycosylase domain-containing protein [Stellaceae bacterium]